MQGRFASGMRGCASRMNHSFKQASSTYSHQSFSRYNRMAGAMPSYTSYANPQSTYSTRTTTMTMNHSSFGQMTPDCMVYSPIA